MTQAIVKQAIERSRLTTFGFQGGLAFGAGQSASPVSGVFVATASRVLYYSMYLTDPYTVKRLFVLNGATVTGNESQAVNLTGFAGTDSFRLTFNGQETADIVRGTNCTAVAIKALLEGLSSISPNTVSVTWTTDAATGSVTFDNGTLANTDVAMMSVTNPVGCTGIVTEGTRGGLWLDVGVYSSNPATGVPATKLVSSGEYQQAGANICQYLDVTDTHLPAGRYWMGLASQNVTATGFRTASAQDADAAKYMMSQSSTFPLPATATPVTTILNGFFLFGMTNGTSP